MGKVLGGFQVVEVLGKGGMATVYRGRRPGKPDVAIKVLDPKRTKDPREVKQFHYEASTLAKLKHPHIISVHEVGEQDEVHFLVLDLIAGGSLMDELQKAGRFAAEKTGDFGRQIAAGLAASHGRGVVHRDIKPHNVLVAAGEQLKITDFGLAIMEDGSGGMFGGGKVVGTPHYMSPEQVDAEDVDARTDIYALGASMYHMVTGTPMFTARSAVELLVKQCTQPPEPPHERNPEVPAWLSGVILKMLEKERALRYQRCEEVIADLERHAPPAPPAAPPPPPVQAGLLLADRPPAPIAPRPLAIPRSPLVTWGWAALILCALGLGLAGRGPLLEVLAPPPDEAALREEEARRALERCGALLREAPPLEHAARLDALAAAFPGAAAAAEAQRAAEALRTELRAAQEREVQALQAKVAEARGQGRLGPARALLAALPPGLALDLRGALEALRAELDERLAALGVVWVPGGAFWSGEGQARRERFVEGFYVQAREVSCAEWAEYVAKGGGKPPAGWQGGAPARPELPVTGISGAEAAGYARWRGARLPKSWEWERAARGAVERRWPWGDEADPARCLWGSAALGPCGGAAGDVTPEGIHDLAGNARELTLDVGSSDAAPRIVVRGGGVGTRCFENTRAAYSLMGVSGEERHPGVGFRCVFERLPEGGR
ncbi:MAG: bifunctional serine/threonine-protein kinase/formylglycine-generating enzyme family protein [Planctomycetota bacterium]